MRTLLQKIKYLIMGVVIGLMVSGSVAFAAGDYILSLFEVKMVFNGVERKAGVLPFQFYNGQTYVPVSLNYNGTTYVPLRFFSESMGQPVTYEEESKTIYVGQIPGNKDVPQYMADVLRPYYIGGGNYTVNPSMSLAGKTYNKGYQINHYYYSTDYCTLSFNLGGEYKNITGTIGLDDISNTSDGELHFYGDETLIASFELKAGGLPQNIELNVEGVKKLDIKYKANYSPLDFVDVKIK